MVFLQPVRSDLRVHWRRLMVVGCLLLLTAECAFFCAMLSSAPGAIGLLGAILFCAGALSLRAVVCPTDWPGSLAQNANAAVYLLVGVWMMLGPPHQTQTVSLLLVVLLLGSGSHRVTGAWAQRGLHWRWNVLYGCASLILGLQLLLSLPDISTARLAAILGTEFAFGAATWLGYAWLGWRNYQMDALLAHVHRRPRMSGY